MPFEVAFEAGAVLVLAVDEVLVPFVDGPELPPQAATKAVKKAARLNSRRVIFLAPNITLGVLVADWRIGALNGNGPDTGRNETLDMAYP